MCNKKTSIIIIGCGRMGNAIVNGWLKNGVPGESISIIDPHPEVARPLIEKGISHYQASNHISSEKKFDVILIALKPQAVGVALPHYKTFLKENSIVVSIAAGVPNRTFTNILGESTSIIRVMPNTPALIGKGVMVGCPNSQTSEEQKTLCHSLFETLGNFYWVENEEHMHAVTAVSGSGPAYLFYFIECMVGAAVDSGLPLALAKDITIDTILGSALLADNDSRDVSDLRKEVTSPNGTTQAALDIFTSNNKLSDIVYSAIESAKNRSIEMQY